MPPDRNSPVFQEYVARQLGINLDKTQSGKIAILHPRFTHPGKQPPVLPEKHDLALWGSREQGFGVVEYEQLPARKGYLKSAPSVVRIVKTEGTHSQPGRADHAGSGVFVHPEGMVATNAHVSDNGHGIKVETHDGRTFAARVVASDRATDLSILQLIDVPGNTRFPVPEFVSSPNQLLDARVAAVGHHGGLKGLSASPGTFKGDVGWMEGFKYKLDSVVAGASGSPVFDSMGRLVGGLVASTYNALPGVVTGPKARHIELMLRNLPA